MPNNPRQQIKKDLDRALNHCDWIKQVLVTTGEKYRADHPDILAQYQTTFAFVEQLEGLLQALRDTY